MTFSPATVDDPTAVATFAVVSTAEIAKNKVIPGLLSVPSTVIIDVSSRSKERALESIREQILSPTSII
jgi:hypothetical protein